MLSQFLLLFRLRSLILILLLLTAGQWVQAQSLRLHPLVSPGMVLQRSGEARIWGWAKPGADVLIDFRGKGYVAKAGADGAWSQMIQTGEGGGPFLLTVKAGKAERKTLPVYVGEVWLAGGQSNMEMTVGALGDAAQEVYATAHDSLLRMVTLTHEMASVPQDTVRTSGWQPADSAHVGSFSAVAYFFARRLRQRLNVPVGIVTCTWGGTPVEAWMSGTALRAFPEFSADILTLAQTGGDLKAIRRAQVEDSKRLYAMQMSLLAKTDSLFPYTPKSWLAKGIPTAQGRMVTLPGMWEQQGMPEFDGVGYYATRVAIPKGWNRKQLRVSLGRIDDADSTYVNGVFVGLTSDWLTLRSYPVPKTALRDDSVRILIRVLDNGGSGGIHGKPEELYMTDGQHRLPLHTWRQVPGVDFRRHRIRLPMASTPPPSTPQTLYNGMVAPSRMYTVKGVIWYQGESNVARAVQYERLFPALIRDWRVAFGQPEMPFLFVQLAGFTQQTEGCHPSVWAELRESQRLSLAVPVTGMATAVDLGDANDIHPRRKAEVGERLALVARRVVYGEADLLASGPEYAGMNIEGRQIVLSFRWPAGLRRINSTLPVRGFCIAGADRIWHSADAWVDGETVRVSSSAVPEPVAVRYGWLENPTGLNLENEAGLPALPFRTDNWPLTTLGALHD